VCDGVNRYHFVGWSVFIVLALEVLAKLTYILPPYICRKSSAPSSYIPVRGRPLEKFTSTDYLYQTTTKIGTSFFSYHALHYCNTNANVKWLLHDIDIINCLVAVPLLFMGYDLTYYCKLIILYRLCSFCLLSTLPLRFNHQINNQPLNMNEIGFHRLLHTNAFYGWVHKHHHRQNAPFRGNTDAINIHPVEMLGGEWNHLLWLHILALTLPTGSYLNSLTILPCSPSASAYSVCYLAISLLIYNIGVHVIAVLIFIISGGIMASLNHTRYDLRLPLLPWLWQVRFHDVHHWAPKTNYAQYTLFWDHVVLPYSPLFFFFFFLAG
jgi:sterol desaturase/sphingolipid hydroxylase (fatty acid hydroxylase superfamily)